MNTKQILIYQVLHMVFLFSFDSLFSYAKTKDQNVYMFDTEVNEEDNQCKTMINLLSTAY